MYRGYRWRPGPGQRMARALARREGQLRGKSRREVARRPGRRRPHGPGDRRRCDRPLRPPLSGQADPGLRHPDRAAPGEPDAGYDSGGRQAGRQQVLGLLPGPPARTVGPHHGVQRAGAFAGPRHRLQLRRRQRPEEPVPLPGAGHGRGRDADQREAHGRRSTPTTPRTPSRCRSCGISVPIKGVADDATEPVRGDALLAQEGARDDHLHDPHRQARALSAGSASCPARPGSSTGSLGRCRRSATWTASSTWSEHDPTMSEPNHFRRILILWIALSVVATPTRRAPGRAGPAARQGEPGGLEPGRRQHGAARASRPRSPR